MTGTVSSAIKLVRLLLVLTAHESTTSTALEKLKIHGTIMSAKLVKYA